MAHRTAWLGTWAYSIDAESPRDRPDRALRRHRRFLHDRDVGRAQERFPDQLVASLRPGGPRLGLVGNLGVNGYTSADLIRDELPAVAGLAPDFVTVLIGVNDVVQGVPLATYEANVATILGALLAQLPADRLVTVGIPDYTVTPAGRDYGDPANKRSRSWPPTTRWPACRRHARSGSSTSSTSRGALRSDRTLVATDGLHPSGTQYALWVERIRPVVEALLTS